MNDNFDDKVINFVKRTSENKEGVRQPSFKGFPYIKIIKDENNNFFKEDALIDFAKKSFFIVTVVKNNGIGCALYKYKVPYESLLKFLNQFRINSSYGKVIDIERYIPEDLA